MNWKDELDLPSEPKLDDFGLTESTLRKLPELFIDDSAVLISVWVGIPIYLFLTSDWSWISIIMFSLPVGGLAAVLLSSLWFGVARWWKLRFIKGYAESKKYDDAMKAYRKDVKAFFDRQLTALGVGCKREKKIDEHHEDNLEIVRQFGGVLSDVNEKYVIAASTSLLKPSKERIKGALLDEIFACLLCKKTERLDALKAGLMELAIFQDTQRPLVTDPVADLTAATEAARAKGLDVPTESLIHALAEATSGEVGNTQDALRKLVTGEQAETVDLLRDLERLAKQVRELDETRAWSYERYF